MAFAYRINGSNSVKKLQNITNLTSYVTTAAPELEYLWLREE